MIRQRLKSLITKVSPGLQLEGDLQLQLESLQFVVLLNEIEKEFDIDFPTAELFNIQFLTLDGLEAAILRRQSAN